MRVGLATLLALACLVGAGPLQGVLSQQYAPPSESECRPYIERALKEHGTPDTPPASIEDTGSSEETAGPEITLNEQTDPEATTAETTPESEEGSSAENLGEVTSEETEEAILERERRSLDETESTAEGESVEQGETQSTDEATAESVEQGETQPTEEATAESAESVEQGETQSAEEANAESAESVEQGETQPTEEAAAESAESLESAGGEDEDGVQEEVTESEIAESESPEESSSETAEDQSSVEATEEPAADGEQAQSEEQTAPTEAESAEQDAASEAAESSESTETEGTPTEDQGSVESQETGSVETTDSVEGSEQEEGAPAEDTEEAGSQEQQSEESAEQTEPATEEVADIVEEEGTASEAETGEGSQEEPAGEESSEEGTEEVQAGETGGEEASEETEEAILSRERRSLDEEATGAAEGDVSSEEQAQDQQSAEESVEGEGEGVAEESSVEVLDSEAPATESAESSQEEEAEGKQGADEASTEEAVAESAEVEEPTAQSEVQEASAESQEGSAEAPEEEVPEEEASGAGEGAEEKPETEPQVVEEPEAEVSEGAQPTDEAEESSQEPVEVEASSVEKDEEEREVMPEEELSFDVDIPDNLRPRDHIAQILKLDEISIEDEMLLSRVEETTLKELKRYYDNAIKPLEMLYKYRDLSNRHFGDPEIFSKPLILFMGPWSGGKSSIINYLLDNEFTRTSLRTGAEPSPAYFNLLMWGEREEVLDGTQLAADWTFSGLQKFGQGLLDRLRGLRLKNRLLEKVNIVEIPGILEIRKQVERLFPFNDACQWFIDRADIIFLVYDPSKLDVGPETEAILDQLKGREYQTRIILNKADQVRPEELMRVQGTLIWNISPLMSSSQPPVMYSTSLWSMPYEEGAPLRLLRAQERAFLRDMREAIDKRVENKIASARRFAVRVRNHAKMVDCYLTTYYNHKSFFGNRKRISDDIIERPQDYHIYAGLSTLTNISRYDLPDPETYRDFFQLNPLYDFQQLSATCTYFKGCPINRLDLAIAYDLPELVGKYKKAAEIALEKHDQSKS